MNNEHFAIVVGINGYSALTPLKAAHTDAVRFKEWLTSTDGGGLPDENVQIILSPETMISDPADGRPIKNDIDRALRNFGMTVDFETRIGKRLYFYFSGHGIGPSSDNVAILMANATPTELGNNIGMGHYREMFRKTARFDEVVFILDCCRDPAQGVESAKPAITPPNANQFGPCHPVEDFTVMASDWGEKAFERPFTDAELTGRFGVLTDTLLKGLNDPAAANANGEITSDTLRLYVIERMAQIAKTTGIPQEPNFGRPSKREIVFKTLPVPNVAVRLLAPAGHAGDLVLRDASFGELDRRPAGQLTRDDPPWVTNLPKDRYLVQYLPAGQSVGPVTPLDLRNAASPHDVNFTNFG